MILGTIGVVSFGAGLFYAMHASAAERHPIVHRARRHVVRHAPKVVYPKRQSVDFEGLSITGELRNPGDFYFQRKTEEKFNSLVKRRKNFHREMLRDVVMAK
jgi:hypothetical protein